jgi:hypothetical protein
MSYFEGDPRLFLSKDGSFIQFEGGQPVMDQGLENQAMISLFTRRGWCGNVLLREASQQIGSDFEAAHDQPITMNTLNQIRDAAEKALKYNAFGNIEINVTNPQSNIIRTEILIQPPGMDIKKLILERHGMGWVAQLSDPASTRESV